MIISDKQSFESYLDSLTMTEFKKLPLVIEGESKEVRYLERGRVVIRFKPTIYSYTANRCGEVDGSDILRLKASKVFTEVLKKAGINHAYQYVNDKFVLAEFIQQPGQYAFKPTDMGCDPLIAPPIEVIVKRMHSGTSKHRYYKMTDYPVRSDHPHYAGFQFSNEGAYPAPNVRFDWRNPLMDHNGNRLQDEVLGESMADLFIDTSAAKMTALKTYRALSNFLETKQIICYDLCLFIDQCGHTVFGEISQDCGRFRHMDLGSLDKDVWRAGGSSDAVLEKWQTLLDLIGDGNV